MGKVFVLVCGSVYTVALRHRLPPWQVESISETTRSLTSDESVFEGSVNQMKGLIESRITLALKSSLPLQCGCTPGRECEKISNRSGSSVVFSYSVCLLQGLQLPWASGGFHVKTWVVVTARAGCGRRKTPRVISHRNGKNIGLFWKIHLFTGTWMKK